MSIHIQPLLVYVIYIKTLIEYTPTLHDHDVMPLMSFFSIMGLLTTVKVFTSYIKELTDYDPNRRFVTRSGRIFVQTVLLFNDSIPFVE